MRLIFQLLADWGAAVRLGNLHVHFLSVFLVRAGRACRQRGWQVWVWLCVSTARCWGAAVPQLQVWLRQAELSSALQERCGAAQT